VHRDDFFRVHEKHERGLRFQTGSRAVIGLDEQSLSSGLPAVDTWWLYVLLCANERLYVGIARDVDARFALHCSGKGAFYTRLNAPLRVVARQRYDSRSAALRAEYALKQFSKREKLAWVATLAGDSCFATSGRGAAPHG
jgi:putative endonuclease